MGCPGSVCLGGTRRKSQDLHAGEGYCFLIYRNWNSFETWVLVEPGAAACRYPGLAELFYPLVPMAEGSGLPSLTTTEECMGLRATTAPLASYSGALGLRVIIRPTDAIFFYSLGLLRTWWSQVGRLFTWELTSEKVQFGGSLLHFCFLKVRTRHIIPDPRTGKQDLSPRGGIGRVCGHLESRAAVSPPISVLQLVGGGSCREKGKLPFQHLQVPWNRWTKLKQERCADLLLHKHGQSLEHDFLAQHWLEAYMPFFL